MDNAMIPFGSQSYYGQESALGAFTIESLAGMDRNSVRELGVRPWDDSSRNKGRDVISHLRRAEMAADDRSDHWSWKLEGAQSKDRKGHYRRKKLAADDESKRLSRRIAAWESLLESISDYPRIPKDEAYWPEWCAFITDADLSRMDADDKSQRAPKVLRWIKQERDYINSRIEDLTAHEKSCVQEVDPEAAEEISEEILATWASEKTGLLDYEQLLSTSHQRWSVWGSNEGSSAQALTVLSRR